MRCPLPVLLIDKEQVGEQFWLTISLCWTRLIVMPPLDPPAPSSSKEDCAQEMEQHNNSAITHLNLKLNISEHPRYLS